MFDERFCSTKHTGLAGEATNTTGGKKIWKKIIKSFFIPIYNCYIFMHVLQWQHELFHDIYFYGSVVGSPQRFSVWNNSRRFSTRWCLKRMLGCGFFDAMVYRFSPLTIYNSLRYIKAHELYWSLHSFEKFSIRTRRRWIEN